VRGALGTDFDYFLPWEEEFFGAVRSLPKTPISTYLIGRQRPSGKQVPSFAVEPALVDTGRPEACAARLRFGLL